MNLHLLFRSAILVTLFVSSAATAQYPTKPIKIVVPATAGDGCEVTHVGCIEIRDAPGADLAVALQALEGGHRLSQGYLSPPVQQVKTSPW